MRARRSTETDRRTSRLLVVFVTVVVVAVLATELGYGTVGVQNESTVTVVDENGSKAVVEVDLAVTSWERYVGLSEHDSLDEGEGMLFVHPREGERHYVMRDMDFDIDIVFVDAERRITTIHHASAPEPGESASRRYSGQAKWVLEVPRGYTNATGIEVGDELRIEHE